METFKILEGLPAHVSEDVNRLLDNGWALNGQLFTRIVDNQTIVGQCVTYDQPATKDYIFTCRLSIDRQFDPAGVLSAVYHRQVIVPGIPRGLFTYMFKIRARTWEEAEDAIRAELRIQISDGDYTAAVEHIDQDSDYV